MPIQRIESELKTGEELELLAQAADTFGKELRVNFKDELSEIETETLLEEAKSSVNLLDKVKEMLDSNPVDLDDSQLAVAYERLTFVFAGAKSVSQTLDSLVEKCLAIKDFLEQAMGKAGELEIEILKKAIVNSKAKLKSLRGPASYAAPPARIIFWHGGQQYSVDAAGRDSPIFLPNLKKVIQLLSGNPPTEGTCGDTKFRLVLDKIVMAKTVAMALNENSPCFFWFEIDGKSYATVTYVLDEVELLLLPDSVGTVLDVAKPGDYSRVQELGKVYIASLLSSEAHSDAPDA